MKCSSPGSVVLNNRLVIRRNLIKFLYLLNMVYFGNRAVLLCVNKLFIRRMSTQWLVGAIDVGTTSSRMMVFDEEGQVVCLARQSVELHSPHPGWAEHDPNKLLESVDICMAKCEAILKEKNINGNVKAIGLAVHRESTVAFDSDSGNSVSKMILWMDTRTRDLVEKMKSHSDAIKATTGLIPSTYFSAFKMKWILDNYTEKNLRFATADTWIVKHLTGQYKTDCTNASRTMLMDLESKQYDNSMCDLFGISRGQLAEIHSSCHDYGTIQNGPFKGVKLTAVLGDQQASMIGQDCTDGGDAKCTLGTGAFILVNTGPTVYNLDGLISTVADDQKYAIEAPIALAGSGIEWIRKVFGDIQYSGNSAGVLFTPALSGLLAPFWKPEATGSFRNITQSTTKDNMIAAVFESIAFSVATCIKIIQAHIPIKSLKMDGGLSNSEKLLQMIADCSGVTIETHAVKECTALGAAKAAAQSIGLSMKTDSLGPESIIVPQNNPELMNTFDRWTKLMFEENK